jgi:hypothetical protein
MPQQDTEKKNEYMRAWRRANPEKLREYAVRSRAWKRDNYEKVRETRRRWNEANSEYYREYSREWYRANSEYVRETNSRYQQSRKAIAAARSYNRWTPAEDAIVMRNDITVMEISHMLQRSFASVNSRRQIIRKANSQ